MVFWSSKTKFTSIGPLKLNKKKEKKTDFFLFFETVSILSRFFFSFVCVFGNGGNGFQDTKKKSVRGLEIETKTFFFFFFVLFCLFVCWFVRLLFFFLLLLFSLQDHTRWQQPPLFESR